MFQGLLKYLFALIIVLDCIDIAYILRAKKPLRHYLNSKILFLILVGIIIWGIPSLFFFPLLILTIMVVCSSNDVINHFKLNNKYY
jgi:hypothetical protein